MGKNKGRNKKKVAQLRQERLNNQPEEQIEDHNPWKDLRKEIEQQQKTGHSVQKKTEAAPVRPSFVRYERVIEEKPVLSERKYMYDSARPSEDDEKPIVPDTPKEEKPEPTVAAPGPIDQNKETGKAPGLFSAIVRLFKGGARPTDSFSDVTAEDQGQAESAVDRYLEKNGKKRRMPKALKRVIVTVISLVLICSLVAGFFAFKFMVKYGSLKYLYNYFNNTAGSLRYETDLAATAGADADTPEAVKETDPATYRVKETVESGGWIVDSVDRFFPIRFNTGKNSDAPISGFFTFRGNYRRDASSVGAVTASEKVLEKTWDYSTGKLLKNNGSDYWSGNGWTGQPLLAQWDDDVREKMNMYDSAKEKRGLVEVIYPGMDGQIHFLDLDTGEETRPAINVGMTFKGTATIYPDGTPLLFCGCGDAQTGPFGENVSQRFYIYSLLDGKLLYEGGIEDSFAPRRWHAYDSSPLIDTETDTLIYPGENGVIYTMRLNTSYNKDAGKISVKPSEFMKYTFTIDGVYSEAGRVWGSECSACAWNGYIFIGDNAGMFYCLDVNTMNMVWITDLKEDINSSPILSFEEDGKFIYIGTTLKYGYNEHSMGEAAIYKLNAITGQTVWKKGYEVHTVKGYAGGVLSTGAVGKGEIGDYVIYSVSKTPSLEEGYLVALDKKTGHEEWRITLDMYSWSSTVLTYDRSGLPLIVQGCQNGDLLLIDARDGHILNRINFGSAIEATPVMYADRLVIATRGEKIYGAKLK